MLGDVAHSRSMKHTFAEGLLCDRVWGQGWVQGPLSTLEIMCLTWEKGQQVAVMEVIRAPAQVWSQEPSTASPPTPHPRPDLILVGGDHISTELPVKD